MPNAKCTHPSYPYPLKAARRLKFSCRIIAETAIRRNDGAHKAPLPLSI
jgi:hypothetical protein